MDHRVEYHLSFIHHCPVIIVKRQSNQYVLSSSSSSSSRSRSRSRSILRPTTEITFRESKTICSRTTNLHMTEVKEEFHDVEFLNLNLGRNRFFLATAHSTKCVIATPKPAVRTSVCLTRDSTVPRKMKIESCGPHSEVA